MVGHDYAVTREISVGELFRVGARDTVSGAEGSVGLFAFINIQTKSSNWGKKCN